MYHSTSDRDVIKIFPLLLMIDGDNPSPCSFIHGVIWLCSLTLLLVVPVQATRHVSANSVAFQRHFQQLGVPVVT